MKDLDGMGLDEVRRGGNMIDEIVVGPGGVSDVQDGEPSEGDSA